MPSECLVLPIRIQKRLVSVVVIDPGPKGLGDPAIEELEKLASAAADGLQDYILRAKPNASTASD